MVRRGIDRRQPGTELKPSIMRHLDHLLEMSRERPELLTPTMRQLRRVGRGNDGLEMAEELWAEGRVGSARTAVACAKVWYDNKRQRQGDLALDRAKELDPDLVDIYIEEAHNQRWRGNVSAAIEAALRVVELTDDESSQQSWDFFLGEMEFERGHFSDAARLLRSGMSENPSDDLRYRLALALERSGRADEAAREYERIGSPEGTPDVLKRATLHFNYRNYADAVRAVDPGLRTVDALRVLCCSQLMLGRFATVTEEIEAESEHLPLLELRALALELAGRLDEAAAEYRKLMVHPDLEGLGEQRERLLRRVARAATRAGDLHTAVEAELACDSGRNSLRGLLDEFDPRYREFVAEAEEALQARDHFRAVPILQRLAASTSSNPNALVAYRLLGRSFAALGEIAAAAKSFYWVNPYRLPHSDEARDRDRANSLAEVYTEAWETLPIAEDTIVYESFHGASTSCNPLAICLEILRREAEGKPEHQHIWVVEVGASVHPELIGRENVHFIVRDSWSYYLHIATARYLINNTTFPPRFLRRPGQRYLNTWHGTPWKHLGRDIAEDPYGHDNAGRNFLQATDNLLPNEHTARILVETQDISNLVVRRPAVIGSPRVDRTLNLDPQRASRLRTELGLSGERPVVFYAPTWRGALGALQLDVRPFIEAIDVMARSGADVILRFHHLLARALDPEALPENVMVVPDDMDTNEILGLTDVLVSDYSSVIFDFAPRNRPIVKYVFDLDAYTSERGLYFGLDEVPGDSCRTPEELAACLERLVTPGGNETDWSASPTAALWGMEDGRATQRAIDIMFGEEPQTEDLHNRGRALISLSGLRANGVTRSLRNLMATFESESTSIQLIVPKVSLGTPQALEIADELHAHADFSLYTGLLTGTREEVNAWYRLQDLRSTFSPDLKPLVRTRMQRERLRYFPDTHFDSVIDFDGYVSAQAALLGLGFPDETRRVYVSHSEFCVEMRSRFPKHRQIGALLSEYSAIASVSDGAMRRNREDLATEFGVPERLHCTLPNTIDVEGILAQAREPLDTELEAWFSRPGPHAIIAARLSVEKNHGTVLVALAELRREGVELDLLLLGEGPRGIALRSQARELGISDRVKIAGHRDNPYPAIARSDAMLLPSTHEGQGLVLFEAILLGVPVAASNITGPASVLDGGRYGLLVEPDVAGMKLALRAIAEGALPAAGLDVREYQQQAVEAFRALIER